MIAMNIAHEMLILLMSWSVARLTIGIILALGYFVTSYGVRKQ